MAEETTDKRKPGRPRGPSMTTVATRLTPEELAALDAWVAARATNRATALADAVRRMTAR